MSKFRNRLVKRVMAVILSGAMVMSSVTLPDMTAYAAETDNDTGEEYSEALSEEREIEVQEVGNRNPENPNQEESDESGPSKGSEKQSENTSETTSEKPSGGSTTEESSGDKTSSAETSGDKFSSVETSDDKFSSTETSDDKFSSTEISSDEENSEPEGGEGEADITGGFETGKTYGDGIIKFSVLADMPYDATTSVKIDNVTYKGSARAGSGKEPTPNKGKIPTAGAAFKITALQDATVDFALAGSSGKKIYFVKEGEPLAEADGADASNARWYSYNLNKGNTYYVYVSGSRMTVYGIKWKAKGNYTRPEWGPIAPPAISKIELDSKDKSKINITVDALIGDDGADKVTVYMYEAAADAESAEAATSEEAAEAIASVESVEFGEETILTISPKKSGTYTFQAVTSRDGEEEVKKSEKSKAFAYEAVAAAREWKFLAYGNGVSKPEDNAILTVDKEAGTVKLDVETGKIVPASNDGLAFYYTEIPAEKNFTFSANAHVDSWTFSNGQEGFGIMAADNVGPTGARIWNNSYQAVVSRINYKYNNGEITEDGSGESINMQIGVGSTEKIGVTPEDIDAFNANEIGQPKAFWAEQKALDTTYGKKGTGQYNIVANYTNSSVTGSTGDGYVLFEDFLLEIEKNNTGYFVSYTKYQCEKNEKGDYITDKNGKAIYILDENGNKIPDEPTKITQKYYDTDALNKLNPNTVFVGVFAARHAHITFSDLNLEERDVKDDDPKEERTKKLINLSTNVLSGSLTNTSDYTFIFASNWKGKLWVKDSAGAYLSRHYEEDENGNYIKDENGEFKEVEEGKKGDYKAVDYYDVNGTLDPNVQYCQDGSDDKDTKVRIPIEGLLVGQNVFTVEYEPVGSWSEVEEAQAVQLKSYDKVRFNHTVEYRKYGEEGATIYVSQDGKAGNNGTQDSPLDIYSAVKYALPGQTIILAGGRYSLNRTLEIPKTVCGEPAEGAVNENGVMDWEKEDYKRFIKMIGDPNDDKRPVLDFNGMVAAVVAVGDFWYFKDFDVIRCKDGEKGIQVSGSYCVYDRVDTYRNGSTGLQICRASGTDTYKDWPKYNKILNCNSYLNVDSGFEDADGFAAKLTSGSGNVFDGCIAAFNADDGWDLFAKAQTGSIGGVIIRNSIAYRNGYVLTKDGTPEGEISEDGICVKGAGNGNGFKMGGDGLRAGSEYDEEYGKHDPDSAIPNVGHRLYNSLAFGNKSKGIDSNSAPNIKAYNSISFNNDGANVSLSSYKDYVLHTDYELQNVISIRSEEQMVQSQVEADVQNFEGGYTTKYSLNMMKAASGSSTSACVFISLKTVQDRAAKVKVWWSSSDPEKDCQIKILSEKDVVLAEGDYSRNGELKISELKTSGTEKCYLGSTDGSIKIYKVEVIGATAKEPTREQTWTADISEIYSATGKQELNGKKEILKNSNGAGITIQYAAIPTDGIEGLGQQLTSPILDKVENDTTYYYRSGKVSDGTSKNKSGKGLTADDFESLDYPYLNTVSPENWRNADGTIKTGNFLKLKPNAGSYPADAIPSLGGNPSMSDKDLEDLIGEEVDGSISGGVAGEVTSEDFGVDYPDDGIDATISDPNDPDKTEYKYYGKIWAAPVNYLDYTDKEPINYTGKKIEPEIHVYFSADTAVLRKGKDYTIKFHDNTNAGTATAEIIGNGNYKGFTTEVSFTIHKIAMDDLSIAIPSVVAAASTADPKKLIKPTWQGKALKEGKDYTIDPVAGDATKYRVTGIGNFGADEGAPDEPQYASKKYREVTVQPLDNVSPDKQIDKAKVTITLPAKELVYTGEPVEPECIVTLNGNTLVNTEEKTNYEVKYANNIEIGKATLTVVGMGEYVGSKSITFNITGGNLKDVAKVVYKSDESKDFEVKDVTYDGTSCEIPVNSFEVKLIKSGKRLKKDVDYKVVQSGANKAGNATLTIKGINNYKGALPSYKYKITPLDIADDSKVDIVYNPTLDFMVGGAKYVPGQNFYIKVNNHVVDPSNYKLTYKDNKKTGDATVIITGQKLLTGKTERSFTINKASLSDPDFSITAKDVVTSGKDLMVGDLTKSNIGITQTVNGREKKLAARDYDKNNIQYYIDVDGDYKITESDISVSLTDKKAKIDDIIAGKNESDSNSNSKNESDSKNYKTFDGQGYLTILVRVAAMENGDYKDAKDGYFRAAKWSVARATVKNDIPRIFGKHWKTGSGVTTPITWSDADAEQAELANYIKVTCKLDGPTPETLDCTDAIGAYTYDTSKFEKDGYAIVPGSYKKNDRVGTASFTIIGTGKYAGTKKVSYKIINKATAEKQGRW